MHDSRPEPQLDRAQSQQLLELGFSKHFMAQFFATQVAPLPNDWPAQQICFSPHTLGSSLAAAVRQHVLLGQRSRCTRNTNAR